MDNSPGTLYIGAGWLDPCPYKASIESLLIFSALTSGCFWLKKLSSSDLTLDGDAVDVLLLDDVGAEEIGAARNSPNGSEESSLFVPLVGGTSEKQS